MRAESFILMNGKLNSVQSCGHYGCTLAQLRMLSPVFALSFTSKD
jgi:hypothetical protein